jgi:heterodisulfide reductase subunit B2
MDYLYFPGCTLYTKAKNLDQTARNCSLLLGFELKELPNWTCCGATFPLATDNIMALLPPSRILANAREKGEVLTTLCAVCFNVIKRTNRLLQGDAEKREKINNFIEKNYQGDLRVLHYLEVLKQEIGLARVKEKVKRPLAGLKAAAYYGCMLLRPFEEMAFDDKERPWLFEEFLETLGAKAVEFPYKIECCGSFQSVGSPEVATECAYKILGSALKNGAEIVVSTCPMCTFNIDHKQLDIKQKYLDFKTVPVLYFTQLLGIAMGLDYRTLGFEQNAIDPLPLLKEKGLIQT